MITLLQFVVVGGGLKIVFMVLRRAQRAGVIIYCS
jgi:hypothetical protein